MVDPLEEMEDLMMEDLEEEMEDSMMEDLEEGMVEGKDLWRKQFLEFLEMTIQSLLKFLKHLLSVMDRLKVDIMLMLKQNVKCSIFVAVMEMVALPNTASYVQMEQFSNNNTLYVTGGLMWIALWLSHFTL